MPDSKSSPVRCDQHEMTTEDQRLVAARDRTANWKRWGPYLAERQWGTVREDYSAYGDCWTYFPHDHARSRAYRWGEDGLLGFCDRECRLCFAVTLWNGRDPILKERLFGLGGPEGNHGEDVKECYYYLDSSPTHSYFKGLYKYPQKEFPYDWLVNENAKRNREQPEFELNDTGIFDENRYFDVYAEYAKASPDDILIRITVHNRGPEAAVLHLLPTLWFRNSWAWGCTHEGCELEPRIEQNSPSDALCAHPTLGRYHWYAGPDPAGEPPELLFTDNETNFERIFGTSNRTPHVKDAFHDYVIHGQKKGVNDARYGTKVAAHYVLDVPAQGSQSVWLRLVPQKEAPENPFGPEFEQAFEQRIRETDEFYDAVIPDEQSAEERNISRQAYAGLLWSKQFYHYVVKEWLEGDPDQPIPPPEREHVRNTDWKHLFNRDVISMPDKWEYPWYAAWDLAFHMLPFAEIDGDFAKEQLILFLREWYMHPNGQLPAYEFAFGDVNPPVHAWACWRVFKITADNGNRDYHFLKRVFQKLLLNFTWWVNRKDPHGRNLFSGGFLGLDNIGVFDRSQPLPNGEVLEQADATAWMAFFCSTMLAMALELSTVEEAYEDIASKFFEHFVAIVDAMNNLGGGGLWDEEDGFYYDAINSGSTATPLRIRSMVGIIPLFAGEILDQDVIDKLPGFKKRMNWFLQHRSDLARHISYCRGDSSSEHDPEHELRLLAIPSRERLERMLRCLLDEKEFLSDYGIRALSKVYEEHPYEFTTGGQKLSVQYVAGESNTALFGGNSNWRGPVWFPVNYLLIEALERYHHFYGDTLKVECPVGSGVWMDLKEVAREIGRRLQSLFVPDEKGRRPCHGTDMRYAEDPHWRDLVLFYEYFHGDNGRGCGASHQTGWTSLVLRLMRDRDK